MSALSIGWSVGESAATIAVAFFAGVQLFRELRRQRDSSQATNARISAMAYRLRRQLRTWVGSDGDPYQNLVSWALRTEGTHRFKDEIEIAEQRFTDIMSLVADASATTTSSVRKAYVYFLEALRRLEEHASTRRPDGGEIFDWVQLQKDAASDLTECIQMLEDGAIDKSLLSTEVSLRERRDAESPLNRLVNAIAQLPDDDDKDRGPAA